MPEWRKKRPKENPSKIILWSDGKKESFYGSMEQAKQYVAENEKPGYICKKII